MSRTRFIIFSTITTLYCVPRFSLLLTSMRFRFHEYPSTFLLLHRTSSFSSGILTIWIFSLRLAPTYNEHTTALPQFLLLVTTIQAQKPTTPSRTAQKIQCCIQSSTQRLKFLRDSLRNRIEYTGTNKMYCGINDTGGLLDTPRRSSTSNKDETFLIRNIPPGTAQLLATHNREPGKTPPVFSAGVALRTT